MSAQHHPRSMGSSKRFICDCSPRARASGRAAIPENPDALGRDILSVIRRDRSLRSLLRTTFAIAVSLISFQKRNKMQIKILNPEYDYRLALIFGKFPREYIFRWKASDSYAIRSEIAANLDARGKLRRGQRA